MEKDKDKEKEKEKEETSKENEENKGVAPVRAQSQETYEDLEKLILDCVSNKYDTILLARRWAYELKGRDHETRTIQELIPQAISDILKFKVSHKSVRDLPELRLGSKKQKGSPAGILENLGKTPFSSGSSGPEKSKSSKK